MSFTLTELILLLVGAFLGGFVNDLTGFGTALTAVPIWIQIMAAPMAGALGAASPARCLSSGPRSSPGRALKSARS